MSIKGIAVGQAVNNIRYDDLIRVLEHKNNIVPYRVVDAARQFSVNPRAELIRDYFVSEISKHSHLTWCIEDQCLCIDLADPPHSRVYFNLLGP